MTWQDILMFTGPILTALAWIYMRIDKKFDKIDERFQRVDRRFQIVDQKFESVMGELKEIRKDLQVLDSRISRIEGQLAPRYWEPKVKGEEK